MRFENNHRAVLDKEAVQIVPFPVKKINRSPGELPWLAIVCASLLVSGVLAESPQAPEQFQPQVGQEGKDVVWVPTASALVERMLDLAKVTPRDYVIDLGSGDGRLVIAAAKRGARALGIEYNPDMTRLAETNAASAGVGDKARFITADLFESDFSQATVITMFLLPDLNLMLRPKILQLKPGTRIVSNTFTMGEWRADETASVAGDCKVWCTALLWVVPARVAGTWRLARGELTVNQEFQLITGSFKSDGDSPPITSGVLRGDQIRFRIGELQYAGQVTGSDMKGTVRSGAREQPWTATRLDDRGGRF